MKFDPADTAVVFIDPQIDVLSPAGRAWAAVGASVTENDTVAHMVQIMDAAVTLGYPMFISPHYFYPADSHWLFNGPLESDEFATGTFARAGALDLTGFPGSGADWLPDFVPYITHPGTTVASPHKVFGPQTNDLILQLRKRRCSRVILGGMLANMCVESHLRDLLEDGLEVAVAFDAVAGPRHPEWGDGYQAALVNYRFLAHSVESTADIVIEMGRSAGR
jgi:nicotinamidase-related amidase